MVPGVPVVPLVEGIVIGADIIGVARTAAGGIGTVDHAHHVVGQVGALAAHAGNDDHGGVRKLLGAVHELVGVQAHIGLRKGPVLVPHAHHRPVGLVVDIEVLQLVVQLQPRLPQALKQGDGGIGVVERAGAGAAVAGVGGGPAEYVQLGFAGQGQDGLVVLQKHNALFSHGGHQLRGLGGGRVGEVRGLADQVQHTGHGTGANQVGHNDQGQQDGDSRLPADQEFFGLVHVPARHHDHNGQDGNDRKGDQVHLDLVQYFHDIIHVDTEHVVSSSFILIWCKTALFTRLGG